jgi:NADP-dependent 3-hydroxy acid dehydrogenase YdfG
LEPLLNKSVLIVGATGGIGSETARLLHLSGAKVFLTGRDADKLHVLSDAIGIPATNRFVVDLKKSTDIVTMVSSVLEQVGTIDILINAAGIGIIKPFH